MKKRTASSCYSPHASRAPGRPNAIGFTASDVFKWWVIVQMICPPLSFLLLGLPLYLIDLAAFDGATLQWVRAEKYIPDFFVFLGIALVPWMLFFVSKACHDPGTRGTADPYPFDSQ
jgi:hypothetical protein